MLRFETWRRLMTCTSPEEREDLVDCCGVVEEGLMFSIDGYVKVDVDYFGQLNSRTQACMYSLLPQDNNTIIMG